MRLNQSAVSHYNPKRLDPIGVNNYDEADAAPRAGINFRYDYP